MLKITITKGASRETWELEGRLSGDWVGELGRCWNERGAQAGTPLEVRLKAVSFIDSPGKRLLAEMYSRGVEIRGCGCMTNAVVEEITRLASPN